ncbi:hypothetical protein [Mangrovibacterium marinum]|uniref:hypothetical protein n=1 Tax=Mangrovibacterium marinum TaxID=1639118 RepID=UPI002A18B119|nr:hypothetical protein [Mangrovibacterium marinum]
MADNVLKFFDTLLRKNNAFNVFSVIQEKGEEGINIYDENISEIIFGKTAKIIDGLKNAYYECDQENEQRYYFQKLTFQLKALSEICESKLDAQVEYFKKNGLIADRISEYINLTAIYTCLSAINEELKFSWAYLYNDKNNNLRKCFNKDYPDWYYNPIFELDENNNAIEVDREILINGIEKPINNDQAVKIEMNHTQLIREFNATYKEDTNHIEDKIVWKGEPRDFVFTFFEPLEKKWIEASKGARIEQLRKLYSKFLIFKENGEPLKLSTLEGYFKKHAAGDTF